MAWDTGNKIPWAAGLRLRGFRFGTLLPIPTTLLSRRDMQIDPSTLRASRTMQSSINSLEVSTPSRCIRAISVGYSFAHLGFPRWPVSVRTFVRPDSSFGLRNLRSDRFAWELGLLAPLGLGVPKKTERPDDHRGLRGTERSQGEVANRPRPRQRLLQHLRRHTRTQTPARPFEHAVAKKKYDMARRAPTTARG